MGRSVNEIVELFRVKELCEFFEILFRVRDEIEQFDEAVPKSDQRIAKTLEGALCVQQLVCITGVIVGAPEWLEFAVPLLREPATEIVEQTLIGVEVGVDLLRCGLGVEGDAVALIGFAAFEQLYAAVVDEGVDVFALGLNLTDMTKIVVSHYF